MSKMLLLVVVETPEGEIDEFAMSRRFVIQDDRTLWVDHPEDGPECLGKWITCRSIPEEQYDDIPY